jgi:hypothetical protein
MPSLPPATWKRNKPAAATLLACLLLAAGMPALAQQAAPAGDGGGAGVTDGSGAGTGDGDQPSLLSRAKASGSLRAAAWDIPRNPDGNKRIGIGIGEAWLRAAPHVGGATLVAEGWMRDVDFTRKGETSGLLREGYLSFSSGNADFRIGRQIIVWGRADQLNPTDNLTPRDYTLYMPEVDDQRFGATAVNMTYNFDTVALSAIVLPQFRPTKLPIPAISGVTFAETVPRGTGYALKLDRSGGDLDWSVSYFHGYDQYPDIAVAVPTPGATVLSLSHHRIRVLGADMATTAGRYGLRAEAAYTWTEDDAGVNPFVKNPYFYGVAGADRTFYEYLNINLQYYVRAISNYRDPNAVTDPALRDVAIEQAVVSNQMNRVQQGMSLRISDKWLDETLEGEIAGVANFTRHDFMLRPKLVYAFNDYWKSTLGGYLYRGGANTFFGLIKDRSGAYAEARYSF